MEKNDYEITTILFDWDGCLAMSLPIWMRHFKLIFKELGVDYSLSESAEIIFGEKNLYNELPRTRGEYLLAKEKVESRFNLIQELGKVSLYPHAAEAIEGFSSAGKKLAVVSSSHVRSFIRPVLIRKKLEKHFDVLVGADEVFSEKPSAEPVLYALQRLNSQPGQAIMIGDTANDVHAGKAAGVKTAIFYPPENEKYYTRESLEKLKPDYFITDLREIYQLII